jgi:hypothetical protein
MNIGQEVFVMKQIGKEGTPTRTKGVIERFSSNILINGKHTAVVRFSSEKYDYHFFPIDEIELAN